MDRLLDTQEQEKLQVKINTIKYSVTLDLAGCCDELPPLIHKFSKEIKHVSKTSLINNVLLAFFTLIQGSRKSQMRIKNAMSMLFSVKQLLIL